MWCASTSEGKQAATADAASPHTVTQLQAYECEIAFVLAYTGSLSHARQSLSKMTSSLSHKQALVALWPSTWLQLNPPVQALVHKDVLCLQPW